MGRFGCMVSPWQWPCFVHSAESAWPGPASGLLNDWLEMLDPEVISSCPDLQQKLLFSWNKVRVVGQRAVLKRLSGYWPAPGNRERAGFIFCPRLLYEFQSSTGWLGGQFCARHTFLSAGLMFPLTFIFAQLCSFKDFRVLYRYNMVS